jgi:hypothetical protein
VKPVAPKSTKSYCRAFPPMVMNRLRISSTGNDRAGRETRYALCIGPSGVRQLVYTSEHPHLIGKHNQDQCMQLGLPGTGFVCTPKYGAGRLTDH